MVRSIITARARVKAPAMGLVGLFVFTISVLTVISSSVATAATSSNLNFQARLLGSNGTIVPDGNYNIDFKLYTADSTTGTVGTCTGSCVWEETRKNSNSQGVQVINGYFSVNLGSVTPFSSTINWDQQLWLTMNIGGTTTGASPTWDGEMQNAGHSIALTALPYAFAANKLTTGTGTSRGTLSFAALGQATTITLPDPGAASATICYQNSAACGFLTGSSTDYVQNQTATFQAANYKIQSSAPGTVTATISGASGQSVDIFDVQTFGATTPSLKVASGGSVAVNNTSTSAFQIQKSDGTGNLFVADTSNTRIGIGKNNPAATLDISVNANDPGLAITNGAGATGNLLSLTHGTSTVLNISATGSTTFKNSSDTATAFQVQNAANSKAVFTVDTSAGQVVLGTGGASGVTGKIVANFSGSSGSITLTPADPTTNAFTLTLPAETGTLCTSAASAACTNAYGTAGTFLSKNTVDTASAAAGSGTLYTFTNSTSGGTGGVLKLVNGNNTGSVLSLQGSSTTAFQLQNSSSQNVLVVDSSSNPAHLKVYDGTATQAYVDIYYDDSTSSAVIAASTGTTKIGNGSGAVTINAGSSSAVTITGHAASSFTTDSGALTLDGAGGVNIGTTAQSETIQIGTTAANTGNTQTINIGNTTSAGTTNVVIGVGSGATGGTTTVQGLGAVSVQSIASSLTLDTAAAGQTVSIANSNVTHTVQIGTGAAAQTVTLGSTNTTSTTTINAGSGNLNLTPSGASNTGVVVKPGANSTGAFQVQNSTTSKSVLTVDTTNNQLLLGSPGVGGITGGIKLFYAGSSGSISLVMSDPGSNNYTLTIPSGGGTICTTANGLCSGGGGGGTGLAKNAVDTSSADALTGFLYTFTNTGNAETGGVLSLDNGNNTGSALFLKDTSAKAFQLQNASSFNALVADTSGTYTHLKVYDGTATQAYADIYYDDSASSAIFVASSGTTQIGGGSVPTLVTAGSSQALTLTGHASSSWTLDNGDLTLDVTGTNPTLNIGTGATAKTLVIGNQSSTTAVTIKSGTGNINLNPVGTSNSGVVIKPQNASTLALQVQNSTSSKVVMSVDNSGNQVVIGDGSASGITGKLAFNFAGASGKILLTPVGSPGASTFTLQLPNENGTLCTTAGSAACLAVYGGGSGSFLAKDAVDTSSADSGSGALYTFTNSGSAGSGGVLKLNNGTNTGSTLIATTTGNPGAGKAVIYAENKNASPSGNLLDLEAGTTPTSVFSVDAAGNVIAATQLSVAGTTLNGNSLIFGDAANPSAVQAATGQPLNITSNASALWQVGGTNQNLTIQTSGTGTLAIDTVGAGTVNLGNTNATTIGIGSASGAVTTIGGGDVVHTIHIGDGGATSAQTISIGSTGGASITTIAAGSGNINFNAWAAQFTEVTGTRTLGIQTRSTNVAGTNFTIQAGAGGSGASAVTGGTMSLIGGNAAGTGNANGGNVNISGGTGTGSGAKGLVILSTPTFSTTVNDPNCYTGGALVASSCTIAQSSVDGTSAVIVGFNQSGQTATLPDPTITTPGRVVYITAANGSSDFTLAVNGGSGIGNQIAMRQNTSATMIWSGSDWTAAGASSSTTLQAAYDNTLQSAGGAELVVSKTSATNGLTIRDSLTNPVNGTLLSVQTASAATLLSVNDNVTEYSSDGGAEVADGTISTFPAGTWSAIGGSTVSRFTTTGNFIATGQGSVSVATTTAANDGVKDALSDTLTANMHYNVSFAARLSSGTFTDMNVYYSVDGTAASVVCATGKAITTSVWTKVNCTFAAPASGMTSSNAILIRQTGSGTARTFYIDNLSVTIAADFNYATDGGVDDGTNFSTNWTQAAGATVTRSTTTGNDASDSAQVVTTGTGQGVRNKLSINPLTNTLYRVSVYATTAVSGFNSFTVRYSRDGGTNFVNCADYNTQTITQSLTNTDFTQITCYITTGATAATSPYVYFTQSDATGRTFYVDTFSMTLYTNTAPNIQIGGGVNGGPVALLTLDRAAAAPIASNNDALLGSMYYDTTLGKLQCYEADGWGACGSSPDNIVTISPEFTNAVMHGTGVGTMTSDICSSTLHINDGTSGQATICGSNETFNFYKWTSPQATPQTYSIYVTYELPNTFKTFASGQTSIMGRTDSSNATVQYSVYRNNSSSGLTLCGPAVTVSTGSVSSWQTGTATGAADPSTCGFSPGDSIVFKIDITASSNADAYVGNLNFTFSNK